MPSRVLGPKRQPGRDDPAALLMERISSLLGRDHLAACLGALVDAAHVDVSLALAVVLALARILHPGAASLAFARVDTGAVHFPAGLLCGAGDDVAGKNQTCRGARDEHASSDLDRSLVHSLFLLWLWVCFAPSSHRGAALDF